MAPALLLYAAAINAAAFGLFAADKRRAMRNERRISERDLLTCAALGGVVGAITAQQLFRHKTRKEPFRTILIALFVAWALAAVVLVTRWG